MKKIMLSLATSALLAACGGAQDDSKKVETPAQQDQGVNVAKTVDASTAKALPTVIVAKVPLDANGNEIVGQGEARQIHGNGQISNGETAVAAFSKGKGIQIADELDDNSSSSQWHNYYYWNTPWYLGKALGRGLWWGRNPYLWQGGYSYGYNYVNSYRFNNCNYYTYYPSYGYGNNGGYYGW